MRAERYFKIIFRIRLTKQLSETHHNIAGRDPGGEEGSMRRFSFTPESVLVRMEFAYQDELRWNNIWIKSSVFVDETSAAEVDLGILRTMEGMYLLHSKKAIRCDISFFAQIRNGVSGEIHMEGLSTENTSVVKMHDSEDDIRAQLGRRFAAGWEAWQALRKEIQ